MAEFNILNESFIANTSGVGQVVDLNAIQVRDLLEASASVTLSGVTVALFIDLGAQKDVDRFDYSFIPVTTSGVTISYGRSADDLIPGSLSIFGQTVRMLPTASGYSFPRFFKLQHVIPSGTPKELTGLEVFNNDEDLNFGQDGSLTSFDLIGEGNTEDVVYELFVRNDGPIPTDIYVSLDTSGHSVETLEKFYLSPTPTGVFLNFDTEVEVPTTVPWEWGFFDKATVTANNEIAVTNPNNLSTTLTVGSQLLLTNLTSNSDGGKPTQAKNVSGQSVIASPRTTHAFNLVNIFNNTTTITSVPLHYSISNVNEQEWLHPAWDGNNTIFYLNGKATSEIQKYTISTNTFALAFSGLTFFNRRSKTMFYHNGDLIIMGSLSSAGSSTSIGTNCWKVNATTGAETARAAMPTAILDNRHQFAKAGDAIYFTPGSNNAGFYRYNISSDQWDVLSDIPNTSFTAGLSYNENTNTIWILRGDSIFEYNIQNGTWNATAISSELITAQQTSGIFFGSSIYYESGMGINGTHRAKVIALPVELSNLSTAISGTWTSPIFRVESEENFRRVLTVLENEDLINTDFGNLASPTFEVRGSDLPPSSDNFVESFLVPLDDEVWVTGAFEDVVVTSNDGLLSFSHDANASLFTSGYILFGLPLGTAGKMQYKFWWNPASNKTSTTSTFTALYIAPFLDVIFSGKVPVRDPDTNQRADDDHIYLKLGANTDTGGSRSSISFYNGSTISSFTVRAHSGTFYEVALNIDWTTGNYTVDFEGSQVGTGNIPGFKREQLESQHSVELFSGVATVDAEEQFKYLTINRVGLEPSSDTDRAFPVHKEDPLYGKNGSLVFKPTSIYSPLFPKTEFLQFRFTMTTLLAYPNETAAISGLKFPPVIKLSDVGVGESKPVYFKYDFDSASQLSSLELRLKSWMFTDKT